METFRPLRQATHRFLVISIQMLSFAKAFSERWALCLSAKPSGVHNLNANRSIIVFPEHLDNSFVKSIVLRRWLKVYTPSLPRTHPSVSDISRMKWSCQLNVLWTLGLGTWLRVLWVERQYWLNRRFSEQGNAGKWASACDVGTSYTIDKPLFIITKRYFQLTLQGNIHDITCLEDVIVTYEVLL